MNLQNVLYRVHMWLLLTTCSVIAVSAAVQLRKWRLQATLLLKRSGELILTLHFACLLYTSDAADDWLVV